MSQSGVRLQEILCLGSSGAQVFQKEYVEGGGQGFASRDLDFICCRSVMCSEALVRGPEL